MKLPDFLPNLGTLHVDPKTLPAGPFLAYDRDGKLVSTAYMIPNNDLAAQKKFDDLAASGAKVDHVTSTSMPATPAVRSCTPILWATASAPTCRRSPPT